MALKLKNRSQGSLKKVMIYGLDGSGKSTFCENYCIENNLHPVVIDVDDTNYSNLPILEINFENDIKTFDNLKNTIKEIKKSEFDTIVIDGVTSLLELLTSNAKGMAAYSDRSKRWNKIINLLLNSGKHLIFIGQADMEVIYSDDFQSSKAVIKVNSIVNEKYRTYIEKGEYKSEILKFRTYKGEPVKTGTSTPTFETADTIETIDGDPVAENLARSLCIFAKKQGKPCRKGVLIACAKNCDKLSQEEKDKVIQYLKGLPNGEVRL